MGSVYRTERQLPTAATVQPWVHYDPWRTTDDAGDEGAHGTQES